MYRSRHNNVYEYCRIRKAVWMCRRCYDVVLIQLPEDARSIKSMDRYTLCAQVTPARKQRSVVGDRPSREGVGDRFESSKRDHVHRYCPEST